MHVMIVGAAGMLGRKLALHLAQEGAVERLDLVDVVRPEGVAGAAEALVADIAAPGEAERLVARRPDLIFHLAAVVSGEAEADFEKGYRINLDGTRRLLEAVRREGERAPYRPRLVYASSIAVFGTPFPKRIGDTFFSTPRTSYGTQKAIGELLLADYARRGFLDGIGLRLPTVCIRPGTPNRAASGFFSNILREPLAGREAVLPVDEGVRHWHASPRAAVGFLVHAATLDLRLLEGRPNLTMPGLSATVAEQIAALRRVAGEGAVRLIRREPDPVIAAIVAGWPERFDAARAGRLGFKADASFDAIIEAHVEDELGGCLP
ncbi:MAG: SDR family oxidoreductase [Geminicoccaceae bacterium]|nr:SDR family oxidoreductase [Geminicoccaceae bacterium]